MKIRIETLEKQLSEHKATATISELQGKVPTADEIEQCCEVLASIESQTARICKQIEKIDQAQKQDERRRSLSKDSSATIIAELANLMGELKNVHNLMDGIKSCNPSFVRRSPLRELVNSPRGECSKCKENEALLNEQQNEIMFYKKKNKDLTNQMQDLETEKKSVREFEIKYKKLESIFDQEREKMNSERSRTKNEIVALKKIAEDAEELLKRSSDDLKRKEQMWKSEKASLDREITSLKKQLLACKNGEGSEHDERASSHDSDKVDPMKLSRNESDKIHVIDLKKQIAQLEKKNADCEAKLEDIKISNVDLLDQLNKAKQGWQKDKEAHQHKTRQTEKIRIVEMDAVQQKFSSRMRIMEDTNKSLHSQLVLARRERDAHKEALANYERKMVEEKKGIDQREKEHADAAGKIKSLVSYCDDPIQKRLADMETELERLNTDLRLTKEAKKADQILYRMDRARGRNEKITDEELTSVEQMQHQYQECERFYSKEVDRLNGKIKELTTEAQLKNNEQQRITRELREQIRVLEIDQRNLSQKKDNQVAAKELFESEAERLQQVVHMNELQKLTRKYRLSSIIDQLQYVTDPLRRSGKLEPDHPDGIRYIINQLIAIRDEDNQSCLTSEDRCSSVQPSLQERNGYAPSLSECDGTYDNISQSSLSIRSVTSVPIRNTVRWTNNQASVVKTIVSPTSPTLVKNKTESTAYPTKRSFRRYEAYETIFLLILLDKYPYYSAIS
uniref:RING-type E3 ubiquitin transferase n=1 Tax=Heterorhabditis bacteriophora TaxID=37862 RepID=A0A1I7X4K0_HETBA